MARVKFSSLVSSIDGSMGGITFQRSGYGNSVKSKQFNGSFLSEAQLGIMGIMSSVRSAWSALSADQKRQWDVFSSLRPQYSFHNKNSLLSGYALFLKYNAIRLLSGLEILSNFSFIADPIVIDPPIGANYEGDVAIYFSGTLDMSQWHFMASASRPFKRNTSFVNAQSRVMVWQLVTTNFYICTDSYVKAFGRKPFFGTQFYVETVVFHRLSPIMSAKLFTLSDPW